MPRDLERQTVRTASRHKPGAPQGFHYRYAPVSAAGRCARSNPVVFVEAHCRVAVQDEVASGAVPGILDLKCPYLSMSYEICAGKHKNHALFCEWVLPLSHLMSKTYRRILKRIPGRQATSSAAERFFPNEPTSAVFSMPQNRQSKAPGGCRCR